MNKERLQIAIQKSGRLTKQCIDLLSNCGVKVPIVKDRLIASCENMPIDIMLVRDDDIPLLVNEGISDVGIVGLNVCEEEKLKFKKDNDNEPFSICTSLKYGKCRLSFAYPQLWNKSKKSWSQYLQNTTIATSYPNLVGDFLKKNNIKANIVYMAGSVEAAPRLGKADIICDLVSSGSTLLANNLVEGEIVLESTAVLIKNKTLSSENENLVNRLVKRIEAVQQASERKYILLHAPRKSLKKICDILDSESPSIMPLEGDNDMVALHVLCKENDFWDIAEELKSAGASSILVMPVEKLLP
ncbi:MAG: ATP phosphoribosyltransferase [Gammaproteobacteria bacterium TMED78]|nr:MAG: ATP phosphoribosyltransferase [Gammaproteobacteria bacterium TMED78]|tara:strand:- start:22104 stop:23003 length:900 start_codon:yes stop_codon:yes gene_type:complete